MSGLSDRIPANEERVHRSKSRAGAKEPTDLLFTSTSTIRLLRQNCDVIFHTALDMTTVLRQLAAEGWDITPAAVAALSPYIRERIKRVGEYATDGLVNPPDAFDAHLDLLTTATAAQAA
jgi:Tn3 transposase DDE domain